MSELVDLQLVMFFMMAAGFLVKKIGMVGEEGKKNLTDLVINLILPANIIKSFLIEFSLETLKQFALILVISLLIQFGCVIFGRVVYRRTPKEHRQCLQYAIICSNAGFLGNPVAEGVFGSMGLALASVYLIPQRIMMWSSGVSIFIGGSDRRSLIRKTLLHPCILACEAGLVCMLTGVRPPSPVLKTLQSLGGCNTALSMLVIGMILAGVDLRTIWNREIFVYCFYRLLLIPALVLIPCRILRADELVTGVSVLLAAMPAGATTSILAAKYDADASFATRLVVLSTLLSVVTTAFWCIWLL